MTSLAELLLANEAAVRAACFVLILVAMAWWEHRRAARPLSMSKLRRWTANLGLVVVNSLVLRLALPILAVGLASVAESRGSGLLNLLALPAWLEFVLALLVLDLAIYGQHLAMHRFALLWRLHRMHHSDVDFDTTTGLRFHPLEIVLSMLYKLLVVLALGPSPAAVLVFEIVLNGTALFNHGNVRLPGHMDRWLRLLVVTPDMHRVHHSVIRRETDSNFGFNLPWWDRIFGTYREQPAHGHGGMTIGLAEFRDRRFLSLHWLLLQPFLSAKPTNGASVEGPRNVG